MNTRLKKAYSGLKSKNLHGLIIFSQANIAYLTGFNSSDAYLLISPCGNVYFTDSRYTAAAKQALGNAFRIEQISGPSLYSAMAACCKDLKLRRLGFEASRISLLQYQRLRRQFGKPLELTAVQDLIEEIRQIKDKNELIKLKKAVDITVKALNYIRDKIVPGVREIEIAGELERFVRYNGASGTAFEIIVASGSNSAFAHHRPTRRKLLANEPVLIDIGVDFEGYKSDLTRVFFSDKIKILEKSIYNAVLQAQDLAISKAKEGVCACELDRECRSFIERSGYGKWVYGHGVGHGVGLEVHEAPALSVNSRTQLKAGMIITVEPAVYMHGRFGIRLEDMVLITKTGSEVLSGTLNK